MKELKKRSCLLYEIFRTIFPAENRAQWRTCRQYTHNDGKRNPKIVHETPVPVELLPISQLSQPILILNFSLALHCVVNLSTFRPWSNERAQNVNHEIMAGKSQGKRACAQNLGCMHINDVYTCARSTFIASEPWRGSSLHMNVKPSPPLN